MSDMTDGVKTLEGGFLDDNNEKGANKLAEDIADILDNNSIKEKFFRDYKR